jgi:CzcA family heavy metal efflux pump
MLDRLIQWSLSHRAVVLILSVLIMVAGWEITRRLPVEVLPDLTKPTVVILTESGGMAPEEVEARVTQPLESALMGVNGLTRLRSNSDVSLSLIYAEFGWGTDIYRARNFVQERLQAARDQLPKEARPVITPVASLMGEALLVGVRSTAKPGDPDYLAPTEVRSLADWTIRRRLQNIPGIAEILNMGGGIRQLEIQPDPFKLQAYGVSLEELEAAAEKAAATTTGGFLSKGSTEIMVRNLAMTVNPDDFKQAIIKTVKDQPVSIGDVAEVKWGIEPMRGDATVSAVPEQDPTYGVIMSITKSPGIDTRELTAKVRAALDELSPTLPKSVESRVLFQQKDFIDHSIGNLTEAIRDGAIMVAVVLMLFLMNLRTTVITLMAIPLSFGITLLIFSIAGISVNSMTLGGMAVAIGMVVDDAIVDVENVLRRLRENASLPNPLPRLKVIAKSSGEVRNSIFYATALIILVFLPLLTLEGLEGRLFAPIAITTIIAMVASFIVSLTAIPVLCSVLLKPKEGTEHKDGPIIRSMKWLLDHTILKLALARPLFIIVIALTAMIAAFSLYPGMNKDFLPKFQEETALVAVTSAPGTSLPEMNRICDGIERILLSVDGVHQVGRRLGRAERGDHVVPVSTAEFDVDFRKDTQRSRKEIIEEINQKLRKIPGVFAAVSGPLADRIGHMMSGVSAPVAVKIYGTDLEEIRRIGEQVQSLAKTIPGFESAKLDQTSMIPQLRIEPNRQRALAYGIPAGSLAEDLSALIGGKDLATLQDGQRFISLVMRLPEDRRDTPEKIADLPIEVARGQRVPLSLIAEVREAKGPNVIFRENGQRRISLAIKPSVQNVAVLVDQLKEKVSQQVTMPPGYFISYEGEFQSQKAATQRIAIFSLIIWIAVFMLLYSYFRSSILALQVLVNIPLALMGGLVFTWLKIDNISIATLVGFIAVGGVAARNGIMMISHYLHLMKEEGMPFSVEMIRRGTLERLVPVMMTALSAGIGLIPLVLSGDLPGKEILHPVAVVIVGGLVSSTLLDMAVTPALFLLWGRRAALKSLAG